MPLQNRVTPFSSIEANAARGLLMGNRGCLHNAHQELVSTRWRHRNWISCELEYKETKRTLMKSGVYTELFFLDEAVALAAGHRPCALCRRADYKKYVQAWKNAFHLTPSAREIDDQLHRERVPIIEKSKIPIVMGHQIPNGTFVMTTEDDRTAWLVAGEKMFRWTHAGYRDSLVLQGNVEYLLLTPATHVALLRCGYKPRLHPSLYSLKEGRSRQEALR